MRRRFFRAARADDQTEECKGRLLWPGAGTLALDWTKIRGDDFDKGRPTPPERERVIGGACRCATRLPSKGAETDQLTIAQCVWAAHYLLLESGGGTGALSVDSRALEARG
jgi:hypothetical protein